ncbi:MAG: Ig-like domain-containing protein, partial [Anaerolineae bacterium]|nr:Ig-like domain-containing protein [Anaerolineae bacterium]
MKHSARQRTLLTLTLLILMLVSIAPAAAAPTVPLATTVFSESMYDGTGSPSGTTPIATFESNNYFQNDALTMSGTGDMRTTTPSSGYTSASGTWNVFLTNTTAGRYFQIADINTTGYTNLTLSFGVYKSTTVENGSTFDVAVSSNGSNWTSLTIPALPTGTGTAIWHYRTTSGTIPATSTLFIRFTNTGTATQFRIDDVLLEGDQDGGDAAPSVTSTVPANNAPAVALNADVTVTFSEPVDVTGTWFD